MNEICNKIFELKGLINAAEELAATSGDYEHPLLDSFATKIKEITILIEKNGVGDSL